MKLFVIILSFLLQGCAWVPCVKASEAKLEWEDAIELARGGEYDFAFMDFQSIHNFYPTSHYCPAAEFSLGEYYFLVNNFPMASDAFQNYYIKYPHHEEALIALAYLFKIAQIQNNLNDLDLYRIKASSFRQLTFIFNDKKHFKYVSGFQRKYELIYYINKVELYVNGKLFTEITF